MRVSGIFVSRCLRVFYGLVHLAIVQHQRRQVLRIVHVRWSGICVEVRQSHKTENFEQICRRVDGLCFEVSRRSEGWSVGQPRWKTYVKGSKE